MSEKLVWFGFLALLIAVQIVLCFIYATTQNVAALIGISLFTWIGLNALVPTFPFGKNSK